MILPLSIIKCAWIGFKLDRNRSTCALIYFDLTNNAYLVGAGPFNGAPTVFILHSYFSVKSLKHTP
jgi:hypothetical protein